jgi:hypothetical protein
MLHVEAQLEDGGNQRRGQAPWVWLPVRSLPGTRWATLWRRINTSLAGAPRLTNVYRQDICHTFKNLNPFQLGWFASRMDRREDHLVEKSLPDRL